MKYYEFSNPLFPMTYQFSADNNISKDEVLQWFKETYNYHFFEAKEVEKDDVDKMWAMHLMKIDGKISL